MRRFIYLAMAVSAFIGFGHSNASAQVINGCVSKNGTLKIVADPSDCTSRETRRFSMLQSGDCSEEGGEPRTVVSAKEILLSDLGHSLPLSAPLYVGLPPE